MLLLTLSAVALAKPNCTIGKPCGNTCIAKTDECLIDDPEAPRYEVNADPARIVVLDPANLPPPVKESPGLGMAAWGDGSEKLTKFKPSQPTTTPPLEPAPVLSRLMVIIEPSPPPSRVLLDGEDVGPASFVRNVSPGVHVVTVEYADGIVRAVRLTVGDGPKYRAKVNGRTGASSIDTY